MFQETKADQKSMEYKPSRVECVGTLVELSDAMHCLQQVFLFQGKTYRMMLIEEGIL